MHYYKRNIGDYAKKAARLTMLQHGAYTVLMDSCYDREEFPTLEQAIDWCWASTQDEIDAVAFVLKKFFTLSDGVYIQDRIKSELDRYHENAATNKRIAKEREAKRREDSTKREQTVNESPPNQKPRTRNQEPETKSQPIDYSSLGLSRSQFDDIKRIRKQNKAKASINQNILNTLINEIKKASQFGMSFDQCLQEWEFRGWQAFKADWVKPDSRGFNNAEPQPSSRPSLVEIARNQ
mgnify:CR=1 FL=1